MRENVARYINHACRPNAESDVKPRKRKVFIRAIKNIEPGEEINYDYGTDYFKAYLKPIGCKCDACEKKRKKKRAEARAERALLKAKAERKAQKKAEKLAAKKRERQGRRRETQRQALERARRKIGDGQKARCEIRDFREREGQASSGEPGFGLGHKGCSEVVVMPGLVPGIHVFADDEKRRGWSGQARP